MYHHLEVLSWKMHSKLVQYCLASILSRQASPNRDYGLASQSCELMPATHAFYETFFQAMYGFIILEFHLVFKMNFSCKNFDYFPSKILDKGEILKPHSFF